MSSDQTWSPFDCLAVAAMTGAGLLQREGTMDTEVELLVVTGVELRAAAIGSEPMVPLTANNTADATKQASQWVDRAPDLQVTVTTHRLVFFRNVGTTRQARYLHLSNVFSVDTETTYFKSPKIVLYTAVGDLVLAFPKSATKQRDECHQQLSLSLSRKQWDVDDEQQQKELMQRKKINRKVGVDAVISASQNRHKQAAQLTDTAFAGDAETLLKEATELVQIIHKYVAALDRETADNANEDTDRLVSMLQDMGMTSALKKADYKGAEAAYYDQTARQLADFVRPKLAVVPVMTLTDVYCLFNRARGSHLLSPEDLLTAVERLQDLNLGLSVVTFPGSGLKVLQDDRRANEAVLAETFLQLCQETGFVTAMTVSRQCHVSAVLAMEQLQAAERAAYLVRDETVEAIRFYPNKFIEWSGAD
jgi:ESCRT-II complex subunit VPS36